MGGSSPLSPSRSGDLEALLNHRVAINWHVVVFFSWQAVSSVLNASLGFLVLGDACARTDFDTDRVASNFILRQDGYSPISVMRE